MEQNPLPTTIQGAEKAVSTSLAVRFSNVSRHFGEVRAVDGVDLEIREGEFFAMLGPSGSGKTTCLRLIAGFERPTSGHVEIFGQSVGDQPPYRRQVNTVFQDYALFPHMNVLDNVAYSLMVRGIGKAERHLAAEEALALVRLAGYGLRRPSELSGGQRQRVALARALIGKPKVLLLDEPLGALDLKLREEMQEELTTLQQQLGVTFVFVTHDQGEAMSMADRIAVFNEGRVVQVGTPELVYKKPATSFVASFVGSSNLLPPDIVYGLVGRRVFASLRPESIRFVDSGGHPATVVSVSFMGNSLRIALMVGEQRMTLTQPSSMPAPTVGQTVNVAWNDDDLHLMDETS